MPVQIACPNPDCDSTYSVADENLGKLARCKKCGKQFPLVPGTRAHVEPSASQADLEPVQPSSQANLPESFGRYKVVRLPGKGGMGVVYLALDTPYDSRFANMPNYRRFIVPGATFFFTVVTHERRRFLTDPLARRYPREAFQTVRARYPLEIPAIVLSPDHLHTLWVLPPGDSAYSTRWRRIKEEFTRRFRSEGGGEGQRSASKERRKERGIWQRRFWEHMILDEGDLERHCDYIHYNPVKNRLICRSNGGFVARSTRRIGGVLRKAHQ